jgi:hypothetical protein
LLKFATLGVALRPTALPPYHAGLSKTNTNTALFLPRSHQWLADVSNHWLNRLLTLAETGRGCVCQFMRFFSSRRTLELLVPYPVVVTCLPPVTAVSFEGPAQGIHISLAYLLLSKEFASSLLGVKFM